MAALCQAIPYDGGFDRAALTFLDCQAQALGSQGYLALAAPGSSVSAALEGLIAIVIALFGLQLLFGRGPSLREGVLAAAKIGVVLALATSWPAYQTVIYDVVLHAPAELTAEIGGAADTPGAGGGLAARLDQADAAFERLAILGVGTPAPGSGVRLPPSPFVGFDPFALGAARALLLASAIGAFAFLRLGAGILLALGPLFVAFLLFEATRWLFEGWLRGLVALTLGAATATLALGVELAFLEPWLAALIAQRQADLAAPQAAAQLLAVTAVFTAALVALLRLGIGIAFSPAISARVAEAAERWRAPAAAGVGSTTTSRLESRQDISRATMTRQALERIVRRDSELRMAGVAAGGQAVGIGPGPGAAAPSPAPPALGRGALGGGDLRRTSRRVSAGARERDLRR